MEVTTIVNDRYSAAAKAYEPGLCCPAVYDPKYLKAIPQEIIDKDYGCGDPSPYVKEGETVLDLGSGGGKLCFIASQIVGPTGRVLGVDMNDDMLAMARRAVPEVAETLGFANVEFYKGRIENMRLDQERVDGYLKNNPIASADDLELFEELVYNLETQSPIIPTSSVDVVVSNCVLNLVSQEQKEKLFAEIYRVLKPGGRVVISDVVADEDIPEHLRDDEDLWGACYSGAIREDRFLDSFAEIGMYGIQLLKRDENPYHVIEGIELRNVTLSAYKGKEGACWDMMQAVAYKGPFKSVEDDDGHVLHRGQRMAVCEKTFQIYSRAPYRDYFEFIEPNVPVKFGEAQAFVCGPKMELGSVADEYQGAPAGGLGFRDPGETKNGPAPVNVNSSASDASCCAPKSGPGASSCC